VPIHTGFHGGCCKNNIKNGINNNGINNNNFYRSGGTVAKMPRPVFDEATARAIATSQAGRCR
jgi:hypothetical protein